MTAVGRSAIEETWKTIRRSIRRTPTLQLDPRDIELDVRRLVLKLEYLQRGGSFKARGAFANLAHRDIGSAGVAAASGGNHGVAVALAAREADVRARVFIPSVAPVAKVERIRAAGAELVITGERYEDARLACEEYCAATGAANIHAFDQPDTLLGQGTVGLELEADEPDLDTILVSVGGGGLIAGVAAWYEGRAAVIGVEPELAPTLSVALDAGRPLDAPAGGVAADSLAPRRVGELVYPIAAQHVDRAVTVPDAAITAAQRTLWSVARIVAEPGGATAFSALLSGAYQPVPGERVGVIVSGANTDAVRLHGMDT